eukprot:TRINITY_DN25180_c1_g1_i3.p1 TRINITY_DN25180_c1_g1~~TRINITY_DN25180_c1_g1_i3.p1  ORF type:complete len:146 (-),score=32.13 TRINITY_DN25180_c1_g1_i3:261-698(-)
MNVWELERTGKSDHTNSFFVSTVTFEDDVVAYICFNENTIPILLEKNTRLTRQTYRQKNVQTGKRKGKSKVTKIGKSKKEGERQKKRQRQSERTEQKEQKKETVKGKKGKVGQSSEEELRESLTFSQISDQSKMNSPICAKPTPH